MGIDFLNVLEVKMGIIKEKVTGLEDGDYSMHSEMKVLSSMGKNGFLGVKTFSRLNIIYYLHYYFFLYTFFLGITKLFKSQTLM